MKTATIVEKKILVDELYSMTFELENCDFSKPGQYAVIKIQEEERAYSVCDYDSERFTIVFINNGNEFSKLLSSKELGDELEVETGLGEGFYLDEIPNGAILVADTSGIAPMLGLVRGLLMSGKSCSLVLGFTTKSRVYMIDTFSNLCSNIEIFTEDGSNGRQGNADDGVRNAEYVCAAGSIEMLDRLTRKAEHGQFNVDGMNISRW